MPVSRGRDDSPGLDPETKAMLEPTPPEKAASPGVWAFTLVLLTKGSEADRLARAVDRIWRDSGLPPTPVLDRPCPMVVRSGLPLDEAWVGQFELICCDSISVFLRDEVIAGGDRGYLRAIYAQFRRSPEFEPVFITLHFVPDNDRGRHFCDQFLSAATAKELHYGSEIAILERVFRKKARMMAYWAAEIGAKLDVEE